MEVHQHQALAGIRGLQWRQTGLAISLKILTFHLKYHYPQLISMIKVPKPPIDLDSECEDDTTIPMKLDFNPKTNNDIHNVTDSVNDLEGGESEEIVYSVDSGTSEDTNNNVHQSSCTRSGLVYK